MVLEVNQNLTDRKCMDNLLNVINNLETFDLMVKSLNIFISSALIFYLTVSFLDFF